MSTFVSVGNATQPFTRLLAEIARLAPSLSQPVIVQAGTTPFESAICQVVRNLGMDEFAQTIRDAELLIVHAGAGTLINAVRLGHRPIVVPRLSRFGEHVDDHQLDLASALANQGKIVLVTDIADLKAAIAEARRFRRVQTPETFSPPLVDMVGTILERIAPASDD